MCRYSFRFSKKILFSIVITLVFSGLTIQAEDFSTTTLADVVTIARMRLQKGDFSGATDPLEEAVTRLLETEDARKKALLQKCRFQLARAYNKMGKTAESTTLLKTYLKESPRPDESLALRIMAQNLFDSDDWASIEDLSRRLLKLPKSKLTQDDKIDANLMLGQALFKQSKWKACISPLTYVVNNSLKAELRLVTQVMIVHSLLESKNWSLLYSWIPRVYRTDAKYDITLNLTIMKAAKLRFDAGKEEALNALLLYRMVLPRGKLIRFSEKKIIRLRNKLADSSEGKGAMTRYERDAVLKQIEKIKELIQTVRELKPYEDEVAFRIGQIYRLKKRFWEGYVLFDRLYTEKLGSDISDAAIVELAITLYDLKEIDRAEKLIKTYLDKNIKGRSAPTLLSLLMRDGLAKNDSAKMVLYKKYLDRLPQDDFKNDLKDAQKEDKNDSKKTEQKNEQKETVADLYYMMGFGCFQKGAYDQAANQFNIIIKKFPKTDRAAQGYYFYGMALMMQGKYQEALDSFTTYSKKFKAHEFYADAQFRSAVCFFGLTKYNEAEKRFTEFIKNFPTSIYVSEAYSMRADILAAKDSSEEGNEGALDAAIADYRKALDLSVDNRQAAYAVFRAAQVYQLEVRWQEIIDLMNYYLEKKGETAEISKAIYWIGKAQISQGQVKEALKAYVNAVFKYGNNCSLDGVDKIITELVTISESRLSKPDRDVLLHLIKKKEENVEASKKTLGLRIKTLVAAMQGKEAMKKLGQALLKSEQDLTPVPPTGLALMCNAAVDAKDVKQMERLYTYFTSTYEDSSKLWTAYRARAYQFEIKKDYIKLLPLLDAALDQYGPETYMDWAQIMKARTYFALKEYKRAKEEFALILTVSSWRGPIFAEAMYRIGQTHEALNELTKAHAFYQRTYIQYRAFGPEWAAKAYLAAADVLLKLKSKNEAIKTWKRMLKDSYVKDLKEAKEAKKMLKKYEGS